MVKVLETDDEGDGDDESSDDPVPGYDVSTPQLCERLIQQSAVSPDKGKKTFTPKDPHDATVQLALYERLHGGRQHGDDRRDRHDSSGANDR